MLIHVRHSTRYGYEPEALKLALRIMLYPGTHGGQFAQNWQVTADGETVLKLHDDSAGNGVGLWFRHAPSDGVEIIAEGVIETSDTAGVIRNGQDHTRPEIWLRQTTLTRPDDDIRALAEQVPGEDALSRLHALSAAVNEAVTYRQETTDSATTAAEALSRGTGVCQDQTHVFLAAARHVGLPARYVAGYLLVDALDEAVVPETETHAWAEAHVAGLGWVGFDPTHMVSPTEAYVRMTCGLDASEAAPIRGNVLGEATETLDVNLAITQASGQSQQ